MRIPEKFETILKQSQPLYSIVLDVITSFQPILDDNKLFFFEEYTDHGIKHIESVLKSSEFIISDESFKMLTPKEVAILILSIILHDVGMHIEFPMFVALIEGKYDDVIVKEIDSKSWAELWKEYLSEVKRFSSQQKKNVFGDEFKPFDEPDLINKDNLNGYHRKLIGEFMRRHHPRLAHEIVFNGLIGVNGSKIEFSSDKMSTLYKQLTGIVARSHGISLRKTFSYLQAIGSTVWANPDDVNVIFLMTVLRIADYIQIDETRIDPILLKLKTFNSPISLKEFETHLAINSINFKNSDSERIVILCKPQNAEMYIKLQNLFTDIQKELDTSWAVLGEVYGFLNEKPNIKFRRITSNLDDKNYLESLPYVPRKIGFEVNNELSKLLVGPLYGNNPTYGVRELIQNSVDACKERMHIEIQKGNVQYKGLVTVSVNKTNEENYIFTIRDNGKGMNIDEILLYFLSVGTSFRKSLSWKKQFIDEAGVSTVNRNGRFGIGVLAAFLIGDELSVKTKNYENDIIYSFETKIDSHFINIRKERELQFFVGTEIIIKMSKSQYDFLVLNKDGFTKWFEWFVDKIPNVKYYLNNKEIKSRSINLSGINKFDTKDFKNITWKYKSADNNSEYFPGISCNGIIIKGISYNGSNGTFNLKKGGDIVNHRPLFMFDDYESLFPLKLDRNGIDCYILPFEEELYTDVAKSTIAKLLDLDIRTDQYITKSDLQNPYINILFTKNGFVPAIDYFLNKLENQNYKIIKMIVSGNISEKYLDLSENCLINYCNEKIKFTTSESHVAPICGGRILLKRDIYNDLFLSEKNRITKYAKRIHKVEEENDNYVVYSFLNYNSSKHKIMDFNIDPSTQLQSIQELNFNYFNKNKGGVILSQLLEKYIGENLIIPYDMDERKQIYSKAYEELDSYLKAL
jgi:molecular chaperone HtpG